MIGREITKAERMLYDLAPAQCLINRLKALIDDSMTPEGVRLSKDTQKKISDLKGYLQTRIDELTAQRKATIALINRIPDPDVKMVLKFRYGVIGSKMLPWLEMPEYLYLEIATLYRYHRKGIDYLNRLLEEGGADGNNGQTQG